MTSMELHNIMEEGSKVQTDGQDTKTDERFETPSDLTPRPVRKTGGEDAIYRKVSILTCNVTYRIV